MGKCVRCHSSTLGHKSRFPIVDNRPLADETTTRENVPGLICNQMSEVEMRLNKTLFIAITGLFVSTAGAQSAALPDVSTFKVGELWEWRQIDNRTKLEESRTSTSVIEEKGVRAMMVDGIQRSLEFPFVFEPSSKPWRVWPLEVGKQWQIDVDYVRPDRTTGHLKQDARVVSYEEVTVPAGKFMAFKIEHDGYVHISNGFNGRLVDTFWYAPAARADVKHMRRVANQDFTRELVKYPAPSATPGQQLATPPNLATPPTSSAATPTPPAPPTSLTSPDGTRVSRLRELEQLRKEGLITQQEYEEKRKAVLSTL